MLIIIGTQLLAASSKGFLGMATRRLTHNLCAQCLPSEGGGQDGTVTSGWSLGTGHSAKSSPVSLSSSRTQQSASQVTTAMATSCILHVSQKRLTVFCETCWHRGVCSDHTLPLLAAMLRSALLLPCLSRQQQQLLLGLLPFPSAGTQGVHNAMVAGAGAHLMPLVDVPQLSTVPDGAG